MSSNIEIEAKILLKEEAFLKLLKFLNTNETKGVKQVNYYIDNSEQSLRKFGFGLRIRERNDVYTLTLKSPITDGTLEKDQTISKIIYFKFKNDLIFPEGIVKDTLLMFGFNVSKFHIITSLETIRINTEYEGGQLSLDFNSYNGQKDYEVESEQSSIKAAEQTLKKLCEAVGLPFELNKISKHARALKSLIS
jgi:uncharacterized protein YjbK